MHCDDKRTLFVLKEEIEKMWNNLKDSDFKDENALRKLEESIQDYRECKETMN